MVKKDLKVSNESPLKAFIPAFSIDPLQKAVMDIQGIIYNSGLPYNMEYRPDDGYFMLKLENKKQKTGTWIMDTDDAEYEYGTCSVCDHKELNAFSKGEIPNYCSCCGSRMTVCRV